MCHVIVGFHVLCVDLGFHVVIGVGRLTVQREGFQRQLNFTTHTQFQVQSYFLLDVVVRLCPVIVNSNCLSNSCMFHIAKTGPLRCCLYSLNAKVDMENLAREVEYRLKTIVFTHPVGYSRPPSAVNDLAVTK